jgi:hypothetical protein
MPSYRDIFKVNLKYIEYLLEKTSLSRSYIHNIDITGDEVEREVRLLLRNLLPQRFQVTHGYIISAENMIDEPAVSPQVDVIIVDTLVPHSIFVIDQASGMQIVPVEAVVGIFEVKRTLNQKSLLGTLKDVGTEEEKSALQQLRDICEKARVRKDNEDKFLPGGIRVPPHLSTGDGGYSNPLLGIISIEHDNDIGEKINKWTNEYKIDFGMIDIVLSLSGWMGCLSRDEEDKKMPWVLTCRQKDYEYSQYLFYATPQVSSTAVIGMAIGFIVHYVSATCGRKIDGNNYFFNKCLL